MKLQQNISLKNYNTFGIDVNATYFIEISTVDDLREALQLKGVPEPFILSGGSNMLLTKEISSLVLYINLKGIDIVEEDEDYVTIRVMAGENWHSLVLWTLERDYGGLENLSLIPGNTGTAPIQNIGAYGVEIKDVFKSCEAMNMETLDIVTFTKEECDFGYRDSYFKRSGKGKFVITSVCLVLSKRNHRLHTSYGAIGNQLQKNGVDQPTIRDVSNAVIAIRSSKLPDPAKIGNSGSFFKNPVLSREEFEVFISANPDSPNYPAAEGMVKVPAGWLIEQCGFKGKKFGDAGVHKDQALVLVNYGGASGADILKLARRIQATVREKFNIELQPEVNIIE